MWNIAKKFFLILFLPALLAIAGCTSNSSSSGSLEQLPDTDGDGITDIFDPDLDNDGIPNSEDPDFVPGSGPPTVGGGGGTGGGNEEQTGNPIATPQFACDYVEIIPPREEETAGSKVFLRWNLFNQANPDQLCGVSNARRDFAQAKVSGLENTQDQRSYEAVNVTARTVEIEVPDFCVKEIGGNTKVWPVVWSIRAIADTIGAGGPAEQAVDHPALGNKDERCKAKPGKDEPETPSCPAGDGDPNVDGGCACSEGKSWDADTQSCQEVANLAKSCSDYSGEHAVTKEYSGQGGKQTNKYTFAWRASGSGDPAQSGLAGCLCTHVPPVACESDKNNGCDKRTYVPVMEWRGIVDQCVVTN